MAEIRALPSRYYQLYPPHTCPLCELEHNRIPHVITKSGEAFAPFEVLAVADGSARPGDKTELDTPTHLVGLGWGLPQDRIQYFSVLFLN